MPDPWKSLLSGSEIRGRASTADGREAVLTADVVRRIAYSFTLWLSEMTGMPPDRLVIAVGHDVRVSGPELKRAAIQGITAADSDVYDCGLCATPALLFSMAHEPAAHGALMIAVSGGDWYVNGIKLIARGQLVRSAELEEILKRAQALTVPNRLVTELNLMELYCENLREMVLDRLETNVQYPLLGLHVVVDAGNGAGGFFAEFLESLGADITGSRYLQPDGMFPDSVPNPESEEDMAAISRAVLENEADLGILFDSDCSRLAIVDQGGRAINRNRLIALTAAIILTDEPGTLFVTDSVTSSGLNRFITEWSGVHYRYKRGYHNVIAEAIRLNEEDIDCPLAIETSGHSAFRDNHFHDDGIYLATWLICEAMYRKREGLTLSSLIDELQEPVESVEIRLNILDEDEEREASQAVIETILSHTLNETSWHLAPDNREGVRIAFDLAGGVDNAWFMLRLSVHDPVMPLNAESDVPGGVQTMLKALYDLLSEHEMGEYIDLSPLEDIIRKGE